MGGFDMIGSGRDKIKGDDQVKSNRMFESSPPMIIKPSNFRSSQTFADA